MPINNRLHVHMYNQTNSRSRLFGVHSNTSKSAPPIRKSQDRKLWPPGSLCVIHLNTGEEGVLSIMSTQHINLVANGCNT